MDANTNHPEIAAFMRGQVRDEWEPDAARGLADPHCSRCTEGDTYAMLVSGMDDALIAYADRAIIDDPVWERLKAIRQAMEESR